MRPLFSRILLVSLVLSLGGVANADPYLTVDSTPNGAWQTYWHDNRSQLISGGLQQMGHATNPQWPQTFDPLDELAYNNNTSDHGKQLTWMFRMSNSITDLANRDFQVRITSHLQGEEFPSDWGATSWGWSDDADSGWVTPGTAETNTMWEACDDPARGTVGAFGLALQVAHGTDTSNVSAADIATWRSGLFTLQTTVTGHIRYRANADGSGDWVTKDLQLNIVPAPGAALLAGLGLALVGWVKRRVA